MSVTGKITSLILAFWAGFISSISFLEAWLKFRAEGVTREIGLGIGKLIFTAVNRVEIVLLLAVLIVLLIQKSYHLFRVKAENIMLWVITLILTLQTFWTLPVLTDRAEMIIAGIEPPASHIHLYAGMFEVVKVVLLIVVAWRFKRK